jgi:hypothetical protein
MMMLAKHLDAHRALKQQEEASGMVGDDPPPFKGRPEPGGTMTGDAAYGAFIGRIPEAHRIGMDEGYGRHMWTALHGKHFFGASNDLVGCGHMSGLYRCGAYVRGP